MSARRSSSPVTAIVGVLWGEKSHVNRSYKPIEAWRERAADVRGKMLPCGHYPSEQAPEETLRELREFLAGTPAIR